MITRYQIEQRNDEIRAAIERKSGLLQTRPDDTKLRERIAYDRRLLAAGERLAKIAMPSGVPGHLFLSVDEQEYLAIF